MLKAWLFGVGILFVVVEFSIWLKQFMLPLPIYILAGAFLAIASNYEQGLIALFRQQETLDNDPLTQTATLIEQAKALQGQGAVPRMNSGACTPRQQEVASLPEVD